MLSASCGPFLSGWCGYIRTVAARWKSVNHICAPQWPSPEHLGTNARALRRLVERDGASMRRQPDMAYVLVSQSPGNAWHTASVLWVYNHLWDCRLRLLEAYRLDPVGGIWHFGRSTENQPPRCPYVPKAFDCRGCAGTDNAFRAPCERGAEGIADGPGPILLTEMERA
jgi:hypothetical protein